MSDRPARQALSHRWISLGVALAGMLLAVLVAQAQRSSLEQMAHNALLETASRYRQAVLARLDSSAQLARSVQALLTVQPDLTLEGFGQQIEALRAQRNFPSLQAVGFAPLEPLTAEDGPHYRYTLVAPIEGNERLLGLDVASQPANLLSLQQARDTDRPQMSEPFVLVQHDRPDEPADGIVIRLPVFDGLPAPVAVEERRARERGSVVVSFRVSSLIRSMLEPGSEAAGFELQVRDSDAAPGAPVLFSSALHGSGPSGDPALPSAEVAIDFAGQRWLLSLQPTAEWYAVSQRQAWLIGAGGVLAAVLLAGWVNALLRTRERAHALAETLARRVQSSEQRFRHLTDLQPTAALLVSCEDGSIDYINLAGRELLGLSAEATPGQLERYGLPAGALADSSELEEERRTVELRALDGRVFQSVWRCALLAEDEQPHWLLLLDDVTERLQLTAQLRYQASHDALTGLLNRREFDTQLRRACVGSLPGFEEAVLLYLDIDQFKLINDTCGHAAGDQLLGNVAQQLLRYAGEGARVARLGGDEFGLLIAEPKPEAFRERAQALIDGVAASPFHWKGRGFSLTASVGAVGFRAGDHPDPAELLAIADTACYLAKEAGRNRVVVHNEDEQVSHRRRNEMDWVQRIREALAEDRFCLFFQELKGLRGSLDPRPHFELLVRMRDRSGAMVPPGAFIPAAERFGVMPEVDRWVVRSALAHFDRLHPAGADIGLCSINLSGATLGDEGFPGFLLDELAHASIDPGRLCFEVTETSAVANFQQASALIGRLRALGCKVALDDFGAGMSSFAYLKNLPVDFLKIDGSFIRDLDSEPLSRSIVAAITQVGHQVGARVVAEFVGSEQITALLRELDVDYAQGFGVHVPAVVPAHATTARVTT